MAFFIPPEEPYQSTTIQVCNCPVHIFSIFFHFHILANLPSQFQLLLLPHSPDCRGVKSRGGKLWKGHAWHVMSHGPKRTRDWKATLPKKSWSPSRRGSVLFEGRGSEHATAKELQSYHWTDDISTRWLMNYRGIAWLSHLNHRMTREALEQTPYWISMNYKQHTFQLLFNALLKSSHFPRRTLQLRDCSSFVWARCGCDLSTKVLKDWSFHHWKHFGG